MFVYDLKKGSVLSEFNTPNDAAVFLLATEEEFLSIGHLFDIPKYLNRLEDDPFDHYDVIFLKWIKENEEKYLFSPLHFYYSKNFLIVVSNDYEEIFRGFKSTLVNGKYTADLPLIYYKTLSIFVNGVLDFLQTFENVIAKKETELIEDDLKNDFQKIVVLRSRAYKIKKYCRSLPYIGDQLLLNENDFIPLNCMKYYEKIDVQFNRIYDFSQELYGRSEHLKDIYDSAMSAHTNSLLKKLTVFTVFIAPLTVITGIYGMNFANMPELQMENAYYVVLMVMLGIIIITYFVYNK